MCSDRVLKTFQLDLTQIGKGEPFAHAKFGDHVRDHNLFGRGVGTKTRRQLHRAAEKIIMTFYRLSRRQPDPYLDRLSVVFLTLPRKIRLNAPGAFDRRRRRSERSHDAVTGVFYFPSRK